MWLLKTEPSVYAFSNLSKEGRTTWDGVKNPVALKNLKAMRKGDKILIYHTGVERQAVGSAEVVREAYPDPKKNDPRLVVVDIAAGKPLKTPVTLAVLKETAAFATSPLLRQGRLSVVPLSSPQWDFILKKGSE
jgi:predicted RNA-binding protein with PUA-like domain